LLSDRDQGTRRADDFRPTGNVINRICFDFAFDSYGYPPYCADDLPDDSFEVRFYEDAFGIPGAELVNSPGPVTVDRRERKDSDSGEWRFSAPIEPGVQVMPGDCYWMEITGMGDNCRTYWVKSVDGNNYGMSDYRMSYGPEDIRDDDVVFCVDTGIVPATEPGIDGGCGTIPAACCLRDYTCQQLDYQQCAGVGGLPYVYGDCNTPDLCPFPRNDYCHTAEDPANPDRPPTGAFAICTGDPDKPELGDWIYYDGLTAETRLGQCEKWSGWPSVPPDFGAVCHPLEQDCTDPPNDPPYNNICWPYADADAYECYVDTDNRFASGDPINGGTCPNSGVNSFRADVWYTVTAPCRSKAVVGMCDAATQYDSMLAVYGDHTSAPVCPTWYEYADSLYCNDDYCGGSGLVSGVSWNAVKDAVYILRLGGWSSTGSDANAGQGVSRFHVGFYCAPPPPGPLDLPPNPVHHASKHRYLSVDPTTNGAREVAIKVEMASMKRCSGDLRRACIVDSDCRNVCENDYDRTCETAAQCGGDACIQTGPCVEHPDVGLSWWVQEPQQNPMGCLPACTDEDWYGRLAPVVYSEAWTLDTLHIGDCEVAPVATYLVYACDSDFPERCSVPLVIPTQALPFYAPGLRGGYADVVGPVDDQTLEFASPDGFVNANDLLGFLLTVQNYGTLAKPQAHPTWVDLHGLGAGSPPNYILNVSDLQQILFGLLGRPWTQSPANLQPGDCNP
jgi:hypothetical protein